MKSWKVRWFVLCEDILLYFKSSDSQIPIGVIPLRDSIVKKLDSSLKNFSFKIIPSNNSLIPPFFLQAHSQQVLPTFSFSHSPILQQF